MRSGLSATNLAILGGALLLSLAFGSLHAFGALLQPLERALGVGRGGVSLGYSLAIVMLTAGVLLGPRIAARIGASRTALACGLLGGLGLAFPAAVPGFVVFLLGYGLVFGFGNGVAYGLSLDRAAAALPGSKGLAIGTATASYGCGAAVFAQLVAPVAAGQSVSAALWLLALSVGGAGLAAAAAFAWAPGTVSPTLGEQPAAADIGGVNACFGLGRLWLVYFLGACGGLMVTAHAMGILADTGAPAAFARYAVPLNALGNILGSALGGILADRVRPARALGAPLLVSIAAMAALMATHSGALTLATLTSCGLAYGALIAAIPVVVRRAYGPRRFGGAFGLVFTAWGAAGLASPYLAGVLYDLRGNYSLASATAIGCALAALALIAAPERAALAGEGRRGPT